MSNIFSSPVLAYENIIRRSFMLERQGSCYLIKEEKKNSSNRLLKIQAPKSIGFSLDRDGSRWDFFSIGTIPKGIVSVSDGIIFCEVDCKYYTVIVDLKSKNKSNGFNQVKSSFALCRWLNDLIHIHKVSRFECKFIGIVCMKGRNTPTKRGTKKGIEPDSYDNFNGDYIFTIKNPGTISINDIIRWIP